MDPISMFFRPPRGEQDATTTPRTFGLTTQAAGLMFVEHQITFHNGSAEHNLLVSADGGVTFTMIAPGQDLVRDPIPMGQVTVKSSAGSVPWTAFASPV